MRRCVLVLLVILVVAGLGRLWKPENIIVKYDEAYGGDYLTNALEERWPECYVECYDGDSWNSFISALQGAEWDMCIVAAIYCSSYDTSHYDALLDYYNEYEKLFFFDIAMEWGYSENLVEA
ncbi:hypothetical protein KAU45_06935, partial [bacterium]|nr:hypothetical protein [bacterium]